jgi:putative toxin-antitoxin system antitoxin component (TIGR02293 family)
MFVHMKKSLVSEIADRPQEELELLPQIKAGLAVGEFDVLRETFAATDAELAPRVGLSVPTLYRRRQEKGRLDPEASDKVVRLARLFGLARQLFDGNDEAVRRWFSRPAMALSGDKPIDVASTEAGARMVERLIGRLEHGVYT